MKSGSFFIFNLFSGFFALSLALSPLAQARTEIGADGATVDKGDNSDSSSAADSKAESEASKYMRRRGDKSSNNDSESSKKSSANADDHYLAIQLGGFLSSDSYQWGVTDHATNPGRLIAGLTYRMGPVSNLADWALRADFIGYEVVDGRPLQLTIEPVLMFPEAGSYFPLYFGLGLGPGIFFSQIQNESFLALDYTLLAGIRFFDLFGSTGLFLETGLKNHILLLSDGQFNGYYLSVGAMFTF